MNEGRYPDEVINFAVARMNDGSDPKDVADEINETYRYDPGRPSPKSLVRWHEKYPMGKQPKSLPPGFKDEVRELVRQATSQGRPSNPIEEESRRLCRQQIHDWMKDSRFEYYGFRSETVETHHPGLGSTSIETMSIRTCLFCGHPEPGRPQFVLVVGQSPAPTVGC